MRWKWIVVYGLLALLCYGLVDSRSLISQEGAPPPGEDNSSGFIPGFGPQPGFSEANDTVESRALERQMLKDLERLSIGELSQFHRHLVETLGPVLPSEVEIEYIGPLALEGAHPSMKIHDQGYTGALYWSIEKSVQICTFWISTVRTNTTAAVVQIGKTTLCVNVEHIDKNQPVNKPLKALGNRSVLSLLKLLEKEPKPAEADGKPRAKPRNARKRGQEKADRQEQDSLKSALPNGFGYNVALNYLPLLKTNYPADDAMRKEILEDLAEAKISTIEKAEAAAGDYDFKVLQIEGATDSHEVISLLRLGRPIPKFGETEDLVWVVQFSSTRTSFYRTVIGEVWIHAKTGKIRSIFPPNKD